METIRFDTYINDTYVRLSLRDGQRIIHAEHGRHDEGYSSSYEEWERDGDEIYYRCESSCSDCDGRLDRFYEAVANPIKDGFREITAWWHEGGEEERVLATKGLHWKDIAESQRDYEAEKMGY